MLYPYSNRVARGERSIGGNARLLGLSLYIGKKACSNRFIAKLVIDL
jgi:hypothetical protein